MTLNVPTKYTQTFKQRRSTVIEATCWRPVESQILHRGVNVMQTPTCLSTNWPQEESQVAANDDDDNNDDNDGTGGGSEDKLSQVDN